ncbi:two-component system response regulator [Catenovulum sediminis]|uniref:EAL domain-containing protein n=1 Tax=Catenovulum sediminis TaxID=1740262 RepID=A0ABV1RFU9_9ALTE
MFLTQNNLHAATILVVDDEEINRLILQEAVANLGHVYAASSGIEAIRLAHHYKPDLILLDIEMPGMDGFEVCSQLKKSVETKDCIVIFVTGHTEPVFEERCLLAGAVDFIPKPIHSSVCAARVQIHIRLMRSMQMLSMAQHSLKTLVSQVPVFISYWSANWHNDYCNDFEGNWFDLTANEMSSMAIEEVFPLRLVSLVKNAADNVKDSPEYFEVTIESQHLIGHVSIIQSEKNLRSNGHKGYLVTLYDQTEQKNAELALFEEKERLKVTLQSIGDAVIVTDIEGKITFMNPIAERMTGWLEKRATGKPIEEVMELRDPDTNYMMSNPIYLALDEKRSVAMALNCQLRSADGNIYRVEDSAAPIKDANGEIRGAIIVFHDVSEAMTMAMKMSHLANHDQLTDLPNRTLLYDRLSYACNAATKKNEKVAFMLIDVDHFKVLNDSQGHQVGDQLLRKMAQRLSDVINSDWTLARLGGDEFVLLVPQLKQLESVASISNYVHEILEKPFIIDDQDIQINVSIGVSIYPDDAQDHDTIMRHADVAMYKAKNDGRRHTCFFSEELEKQMVQRFKLETYIREALKKQTLMAYFQPKVDLITGRVIGAEALARLKGSDGQIISPNEFIPLAEEAGLIQELGRQMIVMSCKCVQKLLACNIRLPISVNVTSAQFVSPDFISSVQNIISDYNIPSHLIELELTESALVDDSDDVYERLKSFKDVGIAISIDDFGTGYSSLSYLRKFDLDELKIDQSFIRDMHENASSEAIVKTIISLATAMELNLVAEGIELEVHKLRLIELGCKKGQGFLFSRPVPEPMFIEYVLAKHSQ